MKYSISFLFTLFFSLHLGAMVSFLEGQQISRADSQSLHVSNSKFSNRSHQIVDRITLGSLIKKQHSHYFKLVPAVSYRKVTTRTILYSLLGLVIFVSGVIVSVTFLTTFAYLVMVLGFGLSVYAFVKCIVLRRKMRGHPDYLIDYGRLGAGLVLSGIVCAPAALLGVILGFVLYFEPLSPF